MPNEKGTANTGLLLEVISKVVTNFPRDLPIECLKRLADSPKLIRDLWLSTIKFETTDTDVDGIMRRLADFRLDISDRHVYFSDSFDSQSENWGIELKFVRCANEWGDEYYTHATGTSPQHAVHALWKTLIDATYIIVTRSGHESSGYQSWIWWHAKSKKWIDIKVTQELYDREKWSGKATQSHIIPYAAQC